MCTKILVCHGDKPQLLPDAVAGGGLSLTGGVTNDPKDCKPATFYITNDGKYAIDADLIDLNNLDNIDIAALPKIKLA